MGRKKKPPIPCVVCGAPALKVCKTLSGVQHYARSPNQQTCTRPECRAAIIMHRELVDPSRTRPRGAHGSYGARVLHDLLDRADVRLLARIAAGKLSGELEQAPVDEDTITRCERWADAPDDVDPWSKNFRRSIGLRVVGEPGQPSLVVRRGKGVHGTIRAAWSSHSHLFDVFYAWRCPCPRDHRVGYEKISDLPQTIGYHDRCPVCGASPLEVIP